MELEKHLEPANSALFELGRRYLGALVEMTMKVEEYLAHIKEYRSRQLPPPAEFNGVPQDIVSLIIVTGSTGDHRAIAALLPGLSEQGTAFIENALLPMYESLSDEVKLDMMTRT